MHEEWGAGKRPLVTPKLTVPSVTRGRRGFIGTRQAGRRGQWHKSWLLTLASSHFHLKTPCADNRDRLRGHCSISTLVSEEQSNPRGPQRPARPAGGLARFARLLAPSHASALPAPWRILW